MLLFYLHAHNYPGLTTLIPMLIKMLIHLATRPVKLKHRDTKRAFI